MIDNEIHYVELQPLPREAAQMLSQQAEPTSRLKVYKTKSFAYNGTDKQPLKNNNNKAINYLRKILFFPDFLIENENKFSKNSKIE